MRGSFDDDSRNFGIYLFLIILGTLLFVSIVITEIGLTAFLIIFAIFIIVISIAVIFIVKDEKKRKKTEEEMQIIKEQKAREKLNLEQKNEALYKENYLKFSSYLNLFNKLNPNYTEEMLINDVLIEYSEISKKEDKNQYSSDRSSISQSKNEQELNKIDPCDKKTIFTNKYIMNIVNNNTEYLQDLIKFNPTKHSTKQLKGTGDSINKCIDYQVERYVQKVIKSNYEYEQEITKILDKVKKDNIEETKISIYKLKPKLNLIILRKTYSDYIVKKIFKCFDTYMKDIDKILKNAIKCVPIYIIRNDILEYFKIATQKSQEYSKKICEDIFKLQTIDECKKYKSNYTIKPYDKNIELNKLNNEQRNIIKKSLEMANKGIGKFNIFLDEVEGELIKTRIRLISLKQKLADREDETQILIKNIDLEIFYSKKYAIQLGAYPQSYNFKKGELVEFKNLEQQNWKFISINKQIGKIYCKLGKWSTYQNIKDVVNICSNDKLDDVESNKLSYEINKINIYKEQLKKEMEISDTEFEGWFYENVQKFAAEKYKNLNLNLEKNDIYNFVRCEKFDSSNEYYLWLYISYTELKKDRKFIDYKSYWEIFDSYKEKIDKESNSYKNVLFLNSIKEHKVKKIDIRDLKKMTPEDFEKFIGTLYERMGYIVDVTKFSRDQGVDVIAEKNGYKLGIQVKRYINIVSNKAVQEIVAGLKYYNLSKGIVITTSRFTNAAVQLAKKNSIELIDENKLIEMLDKYYN